MILRDEDFVIKKINWNDKVSNLVEYQKNLILILIALFLWMIQILK